ncbi:DinB family protein [Saccharibacillus sp. CPCC 101409]|uniref:DinB family protein n=1 Tax=Saccharibacillus sp. CPCC 101409 TaxID=3058041 RepID=UPI00267270B6|nr:DinB family protein [Saccharibacillus sp. CPCC 101409]MDO3411068.1 DinB family protein [Saccharibacillus sp. CPCC 101409]
MTQKERLLQEFAQWSGYVRRMSELGEDFWDLPLGEGKWTVREMTAHMLEWDCYFYEHAVQKAARERTVTLAKPDFDAFNAKAAVCGKMLPVYELAARTISAREAIIGTIRAMPDDVYLDVHPQIGGGEFRLEQYLRDFLRHDRHHTAQLDAVKSRVAREAEVSAVGWTWSGSRRKRHA